MTIVQDLARLHKEKEQQRIKILETARQHPFSVIEECIYMCSELYRIRFHLVVTDEYDVSYPISHILMLKRIGALRGYVEDDHRDFKIKYTGNDPVELLTLLDGYSEEAWKLICTLFDYDIVYGPWTLAEILCEEHNLKVKDYIKIDDIPF